MALALGSLGHGRSAFRGGQKHNAAAAGVAAETLVARTPDPRVMVGSRFEAAINLRSGGRRGGGDAGGPPRGRLGGVAAGALGDRRAGARGVGRPVGLRCHRAYADVCMYRVGPAAVRCSHCARGERKRKITSVTARQGSALLLRSSTARCP